MRDEMAKARHCVVEAAEAWVNAAQEDWEKSDRVLMDAVASMVNLRNLDYTRAGRKEMDASVDRAEGLAKELKALAKKSFGSEEWAMLCDAATTLLALRDEIRDMRVTFDA